MAAFALARNGQTMKSLFIQGQHRLFGSGQQLFAKMPHLWAPSQDRLEESTTILTHTAIVTKTIEIMETTPVCCT
jgi:hypothetical protein